MTIPVRTRIDLRSRTLRLGVVEGGALGAHRLDRGQAAGHFVVRYSRRRRTDPATHTTRAPVGSVATSVLWGGRGVQGRSSAGAPRRSRRCSRGGIRHGLRLADTYRAIACALQNGLSRSSAGRREPVLREAAGCHNRWMTTNHPADGGVLDEPVVPQADMDRLLHGWSRGVRIMKIGHGIASERFGRYARGSSAIVALLTVVVATSLFVTASTSQQSYLRYGAAVLSVIAAVLGVLQLVMNHQELATRHRAAHIEYAALRRRLDLLELQYLAGHPPQLAELDAFRAEWSRIESDSPILPERFRARASDEIARADVRLMETNASSTAKD